MNKTITEALTALVRVMDPARAARAESVTVTNVEFHHAGRTLVAITGTTGAGDRVYATRITLGPKRGFSCNCPDCVGRGVACKHVSALAGHLASVAAV